MSDFNKIEINNNFTFDRKLTEALFKTDCNIHGLNVEALLNKSCALCFKEKKAKLMQEEEMRLKTDQKRSIGIPLRYLNAAFSNYIPDNEKAANLLSFCLSYNFDSNVILLGNTGNGKTHLGCAILDKAINRRLSCFYSTFYSLADIKIKKPELLKQIIRSQILLIDEYGVQDSDFKNNLLYEIINERYNNKVYTIIISNLSGERFKQSIGDPLYSRLKSNVVVKSCSWEDYRVKGSQNARINK